jgi:UDP-N-acetylglucosamine 4,6-dehydratase
MRFGSLLLTGGTGSFGQAFTRFLLDGGYVDRLVIYSRDELKQLEMRRRFGEDPRLRWFLGDVRDLPRLRRACRGVDAIVHGAALKQVDAIEYNPLEAVKTNVLGAANVVEAALDAGVARVVALSTDKACNPVNAYGASKLLAEKLLLAAHVYGGRDGPRFACTRYGNVAGSRGSVIPVWREAIRRRERVTLTDPEMTRFWMGMDAAVALVWWTLTTMRGGELVVPDLPAYRLADLAVAMGATAWDVVGIRPGEKAHEGMIGPDEVADFRPVETPQGTYYVRGGGRWCRLTHPVTSDRARLLTVADLRERLAGLEGE